MENRHDLEVAHVLHFLSASVGASSAEAWGNYAQDISTEDHLENIHQREKLISASSCSDRCVCVHACPHARQGRGMYT